MVQKIYPSGPAPNSPIGVLEVCKVLKRLSKLVNTKTVAVALLISALASSAEARFELIPGSRYTSARGFGMADTYMPLVDEGGEALFYQPAAIAAVEKAEFQPVNFSLRGNLNLFSNGMLDSYKVISLATYSPVLQANPWKWAGGGFSYFPSFSFRGFSVGVLYEGQANARFTGGGTDVRGLTQFIPAAGIGIPLARGIVRLGYSLQWVNKVEGLATQANATGYSEGLAKGSAFSHTIGATLALPYPSTPTFNFVGRNVFGTTYTSTAIVPLVGGTQTGVPASEPMSVDFSFSLHPQFGRGKSSFVLALPDLFNSSGTSIFWRINVGAEITVSEKFLIRAGWRSMFPYLGLSYRADKSEITFAYGSENTGSAGAMQQDIQFWLQFKIRAR